MMKKGTTPWRDTSAIESYEVPWKFKVQRHFPPVVEDQRGLLKEPAFR
jgi:hypothetical protein